MKKNFPLFLFHFLLAFSASAQQNYTLSGYVSDTANGESLVGAVVFLKGTTKGVATNVYGFYSLTLPAGEYEIAISLVGYNTIVKKIKLDKNITLNLPMSVSNNTLTEIVVTADENKEQVVSTQMSEIRIPIERITSIPTIGGETDIMKVIQLMPGIKRGGEGQNAIFVRGGSGDDNLILLDEAVVYNVSHLFGFFSVFNNDALRDMNVIKGGFPAKYGGRLSSVMDIRMKEGDAEKFNCVGGIGLLSSRLMVEGPILKDKMSFIVSGRRSYIDQVFKWVGQYLPYYFYDLTAKVNYRLSDKDRLYFSNYFGDDVMAVSDPSDSSLFDGGFKLGNFTTTVRWNHLFNEKLFSNVSLIHTRFRYDVQASVPGNSFLVRSNIKDFGVKADFDYFRNSDNHISYGMMFTHHNFRPNVINTAGEITEFLKSRQGNLIATEETGLYVNHETSLDSNIKFNYGLRYSLLFSEKTAYSGVEPRLSGTYIFNSKSSVKMGYSRMYQYMHLVSSSSIALPTDLWYPVTKRVKPQYSDQVAAGYTRNMTKIKSIFTGEVYYKKMYNLIEYREGAVLILNDNYEDELVEGNGEAYGFELFLNKTSGKLTGWIGYTLSWSKRKFPDLNLGEEYYAKFDRRHDFSFVGTYEFTKRFSVSLVWVYSTGQRFTPTIGNFFMPNSSLTSVDILNIYSPKNAIELPPAHRLDFNMIFKTKQRKYWVEGEWHIGAYNLYNRAQPYKITIEPNPDGSFKYQAKGLFGFIPSVAYNFKF